MKQPKLSLCMIVKNEAENLKVLLPQAKKFADEIVIVDTGSDDETKKIANEFTSNIWDFKWTDDFAAARNFALSKATGSYFIWLDADDRVPETSIQAINRLKSFFDGKKYFYFELKDIRNRGKFYGTGVYASLKQIRCAPLHEVVRFEGRIHEALTNSLERNNYIPVSTDIVVEHYGYDNPKLLQKKIKRNLRILLLEKPYRESDVSFSISLATTYDSLGMYREAYQELNTFVKRHYSLIANKYFHIVFELYMLLAELAYKSTKKDQSLRWLLKARACNKSDKVALFRMGILWEKIGNFDEAVKNLSRIPSAGLIVSTLPTVSPPDLWEIFLRIAFCHLCKGDLTLHEQYLNRAIEAGISHLSAYEWLACHAIELRKLDTAKKLLLKAHAKGLSNESTNRMLGEVYSLTGKYNEAERFYKLALQAAPNSEEIQTSLGWHYMRSGKIEQAHRTFQKLLATDENNLDILVGNLITSFVLNKPWENVLKTIQNRICKNEENIRNILNSLSLKLQEEGKLHLIPYVNFMLRNLLKYNRKISDYLSEHRGIKDETRMSREKT